jgi:membrane protease YdiL (CAAX protease family)
VSPPHLIAGLLLGHLIFGVSLFITHRKMSDTFSHFINLPALANFLVEIPSLIFRFLLVSVTEELVYRVAAQSLLLAILGLPWLAIAVVALAFSLVHIHFLRKGFADAIEFLGFSLLLGTLYFWTESFILVVTIHWLRNLEIVYIEFLEKRHELDDQDAAIQAIERNYWPGAPEQA